MTKLCLLFAAITCIGVAQNPGQAGIPRTPEGKPNFSGTYEWPKSIGGEQCRCSATVFDRKRFAPLKPGGEVFLEPRTGDPRHDEPRDFCMPAGFPCGMLSANAIQLGAQAIFF